MDKAYLITYDLNKEGPNYSKKNKDLTDRIKAYYPTWCHPAESVWVVSTSDSAVQIRDKLKTRLLDSNDVILVVRCGPEGAWSGLSNDMTEWLKKFL